MTVVDDPFHEIESGAYVVAHTAPQAFRGRVREVEEDPDEETLRDSIDVTRRVVVDAVQDYEFWLEETTTGRVRVVKPDSAQSALNVSALEADP